MSTATQPASTPHVAPPRRRRWPLVLACLLALAAVPVLGYFYLAWSEQRDEEEALAEIERIDPRWRFADIIADRKPIADEENPAVLVGRVAKLLKTAPFDMSQEDQRLFEDRTPSVRRPNDPQIAALRAALAKCDDAVALARKLKDYRGEGRFAIQLAPDWFSTNLDPLQSCRNVMYLLEHDVMLRAEDGDAAGALESCHAILVAARALGDEPYLIAALIRFAGEAVFVNALERALAQGEPPADELKAAQELLAREADARFFLQAMRGERGGSEVMLDSLRTGKIKLSAMFGRPAGGSFEDWIHDLLPGLMLRGRAEQIRMMNRTVEAAKLPVEQQGKAFADIEAAARASKAPLVRLLVPAVAKVSQANLRAAANMRCAMVGIAAERYRLQHGHWSLKMDALVAADFLAAIPVDPFNGQPVRYKRTADGVVVYSVGIDGKDDGGNVNRENPYLPNSDLGFRLWDPSMRRQPPLPPRPHFDGGQP